MPKIVYVDDQPQDLLGVVPAELISEFVEFDPRDDAGAAYEAARDASLWVFDFFYGAVLADTDTVLHRENGLSLFQKWRHLAGENRPATALVSSDLSAAL